MATFFIGDTIFLYAFPEKKKKKKIGLKTCKTYKIQELVYKDWPKHLLKIKECLKNSQSQMWQVVAFIYSIVWPS